MPECLWRRHSLLNTSTAECSAGTKRAPLKSPTHDRPRLNVKHLMYFVLVQAAERTLLQGGFVANIVCDATGSCDDGRYATDDASLSLPYTIRHQATIFCYAYAPPLR